MGSSHTRLGHPYPLHVRVNKQEWALIMLNDEINEVSSFSRALTNMNGSLGADTIAFVGGNQWNKVTL